MLHIIFMLLKIIGMILAVILGLILAVVLIVLFVPIQYQVSGKCEGDVKTLQGDAKISWLFHLLTGNVGYQNGKLFLKVRIAWKWIDLLEKKEKPEEKKKKPDQEKGKEPPCKTEEEEEKKVQQEKIEERTENDQIEYKEPKKEKKKEKKKESGIEKIKKTFHNICDKIKVLKSQKDMVVAFMKDEIHKNAFQKVKKEGIRFLKHICPRTLKGNLRIGFDDPYVTGQILVGASILYPFYSEHFDLVPDFEQQIIKGDVFIKGRIYIAVIVDVCLRLLLCKDIRITYKHIRKILSKMNGGKQNGR